MSKLVIKFGGTSVRYGSNQIIKVIKSIQNKNKFDKIIIVISALSNITNLLVDCINQSLNDENFNETLNKIVNIHKEFYDLTKDKVYNNYFIIENNIHLINNLLTSIKFDKNFYTKLIHDKIISFGEILSLISLTNMFINKDIFYKSISSNKFICTNDNYKNAIVDLEKTKKNVKDILIPLLDKTNLLVTTGFIGNYYGNNTTLGRGGSDYSASLITNLINADELWIYSDVNGLMTCNPNKIPNAKKIENINYLYASEMSYYGAKIIHPKTLLPIENMNMNNDKNINIYIKNTFNLDNSGTCIQKNFNMKNYLVNGEKCVFALTYIENIELFTIKGKGLNSNFGICGRIFNILGKLEVNIPFITQASSESLITFGVNCENNGNCIVNIKKRLENEFTIEINNKFIEDIDILDNISLINIIIININNNYGIAGKIFSILGNNKINIRAISQGSSEISITIAINKTDLDKSLEVLHTLII